MKKISDYIFYDSWQSKDLDIKPGQEFTVLMDFGDLKKGALVRFVGFDDVDNHFGIFVFTDAKGAVLEVAGDFSGPDHWSFKNLKNALFGA